MREMRDRPNNPSMNRNNGANGGYFVCRTSLPNHEYVSNRPACHLFSQLTRSITFRTAEYLPSVITTFNSWQDLGEPKQNQYGLVCQGSRPFC
jgi:hypothetical protein